jgi:proteasome accessory factor C
LEKLELALGARGGVAVDVGGGSELARLQQAVSDREQLEIDYYSFARDEMTTRVIDPARVFHAFGSWYLAAFCHQADGERLFRVDRVRGVRPTGERVDAPAAPISDIDELSELVYRAAPSDARVHLRLDPSATWVADSLPVEEVTARPDGHLDVIIAVSAPAFLERLLLGLGPAARVLDPPEARAMVIAAARRVLERYATAS